MIRVLTMPGRRKPSGATRNRVARSHIHGPKPPLKAEFRATGRPKHKTTSGPIQARPPLLNRKICKRGLALKAPTRCSWMAPR